MKNMKILPLLLLVATMQIKGSMFGSQPDSSAMEAFKPLCKKSMTYSAALLDNASNPDAQKMINLLNNCVDSYKEFEDIKTNNSGVPVTQIYNSFMSTVGLANLSPERQAQLNKAKDAQEQQAAILQTYRDTLKVYISTNGSCPEKNSRITKKSTKDTPIVNADALKANVNRAIEAFETKDNSKVDRVSDIDQYSDNVKIDINKNNKNVTLNEIYHRILTLGDIDFKLKS